MELKREIFKLISEKLVIVLDEFTATHPHENHIVAMDDIIKKLRCEIGASSKDNIYN